MIFNDYAVIIPFILILLIFFIPMVKWLYLYIMRIQIFNSLGFYKEDQAPEQQLSIEYVTKSDYEITKRALLDNLQNTKHSIALIEAFDKTLVKFDDRLNDVEEIQLKYDELSKSHKELSKKVELLSGL